MKDFTKEIWAHALKNALDFGKTDAGKILPKLFQHGLDKKDIKEIMPKLQEIVASVNKMKDLQRKETFAQYSDIIPEHEEREGLPELEGAVVGKVVTRLAPEPSKYNHIGHALIFYIQYLYAKKYKGKCILRFDDTNPEKSTKEFYDSMIEDMTWLGLKWDKQYLASDSMKKLYAYAEKLIKKGDAFVCSCNQEKMKDLREKMKECDCRDIKPADNVKVWKEMLAKKYGEGEKTLRLKGDMKSNNGVMRDPVIFRISYTPHFMQGERYCVWPMYDFQNPVSDALDGVTHVIRSNEFTLRAELHAYILKLLGLKMPHIREIGRYQITGAETQGRVVRELIESGKVKGWDDPRLVTVKALRRRGFVPEMFRELSQTVGLSKSGGHIDPSVLAATNRKIIDSVAERFYFVENPVKLDIQNPPNIREVGIPVHPDRKELRKMKVSDDVFISKKDYEELKGKEVRLLHLYNIKVPAKSKKAEFTTIENKDVPKIQWVSFGTEIKILMPDGKWTNGIADENIGDLKVGEIIQFERFGFVRLDEIKEGRYKFWFAHK